jgi:hypothetical protein
MPSDSGKKPRKRGGPHHLKKQDIPSGAETFKVCIRVVFPHAWSNASLIWRQKAFEIHLYTLLELADMDVKPYVPPQNVVEAFEERFTSADQVNEVLRQRNYDQKLALRKIRRIRDLCAVCGSSM